MDGARNKIPEGKRRCINLRMDYVTVIERPGCQPFVFRVERHQGKMRLVMLAGTEIIKHFPLTEIPENNSPNQ